MTERALIVTSGDPGSVLVLYLTCMAIGSTVECSFAALALCFSLLVHP